MDGLKTEYDVHKIDTGEKIYDCFVLRPDRDKAARAALLAYAYATPNAKLERDIREWLRNIDAANGLSDKVNQ